MNTPHLSIITKTPKRILAIAKATANRSSNLTKAKFTRLWDDLDTTIHEVFTPHLESKDERGYLLYFRNTDNWTLLTSHSLIGILNGKVNKIKLKKIKSSDFGFVKSVSPYLILTVKSRFRSLQFEYESNGPGFAFMDGFDFIRNHWIYKAVSEEDIEG